MKIIKIGAMWCPACIVTNKYWKKIKDRYKEIEFIDYDLDMDEEEVKKLNVGNILPEFIFLDSNNVEIKRIFGEKTQDELEKEIEVIINES